jgi:hypothetical protein
MDWAIFGYEPKTRIQSKRKTEMGKTWVIHGQLWTERGQPKKFSWTDLTLCLLYTNQPSSVRDLSLPPTRRVPPHRRLPSLFL